MIPPPPPPPEPDKFTVGFPCWPPRKPAYRPPLWMLIISVLVSLPVWGAIWLVMRALLT